MTRDYTKIVCKLYNLNKEFLEANLHFCFKLFKYQKIILKIIKITELKYQVLRKYIKIVI